MREISTTLRDYLQQNFATQEVTLSVEVAAGEDPLLITDDDFEAGSLKINYASNVNEDLRFGTVITPDLAVTLLNESGAFDAVDFVGKRMTVTCSVTLNEVTEDIDMDLFVIDKARRDGTKIFITALGFITAMDVPYQTGDIAFPITALNLASALCNHCGLTLKTPDLTDYLQNTTTVITEEPPDGKYTYRQLLGYICEIMGASVGTRLVSSGSVQTRMVVARWYAVQSVTLNEDNLFSCERDKVPTTVDTIIVRNAQAEGSYSYGQDGATYTIKDNPLLNGMTSGTLSDIAYGIYGNATIAYPARFNAVTIPMPFVEPLDAVPLYQGGSVAAYLFISSMTWSPNANTVLAGCGFTKQEPEQYSPFTDSQTAELDEIRDGVGEQESALSALQSTVEDLTTDYITETGTSGNWRWRKWNSGTVELWGSMVDLTFGAWSSYTTGWSYATADIELPIDFGNTNYTATVNIARPSTGGNAGILISVRHYDSDSVRLTVLMTSANTRSTALADICVCGLISETESPLADSALADYAVLTE